MPGTALVIGVRFGALGEITARSVCGIKAKGGKPGKESSGGVVAGLLVVRSELSIQLASVICWPSRPRRSSHRLAAAAGVPAASIAPNARTTIQRSRGTFGIYPPLIGSTLAGAERSYRNFASQPIGHRL